MQFVIFKINLPYSCWKANSKLNITIVLLKYTYKVLCIHKIRLLTFSNLYMYCAFNTEYYVLEIQISTACGELRTLDFSMIAALASLLYFVWPSFKMQLYVSDLFDLQFFYGEFGWIYPFWFIWKIFHPYQIQTFVNGSRIFFSENIWKTLFKILRTLLTKLQW